MQAMVGAEEPVDPAVARRPLPFSRVWVAAFVLGLLAIGWTAALVQFDQRAEQAHVLRLDRVVGDLEKAVGSNEAFRVTRSVESLRTVAAGRSDSGAEELDEVWRTVTRLTAQAASADPRDVTSVEPIVDALRAATDELGQMVEPSDSLTPVGPGV
jgi:hypothetical protein